MASTRCRLQIEGVGRRPGIVVRMSKVEKVGFKSPVRLSWRIEGEDLLRCRTFMKQACPSLRHKYNALVRPLKPIEFDSW